MTAEISIDADLLLCIEASFAHSSSQFVSSRNRAKEPDLSRFISYSEEHFMRSTICKMAQDIIQFKV